MKAIGKALVVVTLVAFATGIASAQKKPVRKPAPKKPPVTHTTVPPLDVRVARDKVTDQKNLLDNFITKLGPAALNMETADADAQAGRLKPATVAKVNGFKASLIDSIRGLNQSLTTLESEFRTKPALKKYLPSIDGVSGLIAQAEDEALAGKFVASKEPLRLAAQKLTDTLLVLPH